MNEMQISKDIQLIREMIDKTKEKAAESWRFFSVWGILIIAAIIGHYVLAYFEILTLRLLDAVYKFVCISFRLLIHPQYAS